MGLYFPGSGPKPVIWRNPGNDGVVLGVFGQARGVGSGELLLDVAGGAAGAVGRADDGLLAGISSAAGIASPRCSDNSSCSCFVYCATGHAQRPGHSAPPAPPGDPLLLVLRLLRALLLVLPLLLQIRRYGGLLPPVVLLLLVLCIHMNRFPGWHEPI
jgi:hypothetical protein